MLPGNLEHVFPYFWWSPIDDGRTSDEHLALASMGLDGTSVFRVDDPTFAPWFEARRNGIRPCRCSLTRMTTLQAAKRGVQEPRLWHSTGEPPGNPMWVKPPQFDPWTNNACELIGWGNKHSQWNDDEYRDHPGNPDRWLDEDDSDE